MRRLTFMHLQKQLYWVSSLDGIDAVVPSYSPMLGLTYSLIHKSHSIISINSNDKIPLIKPDEFIVGNQCNSIHTLLLLHSLDIFSQQSRSKSFRPPSRMDTESM